ncbi:MAG TPA: helix-turn-helix domain-containing protein [Acidimicrobiales bacterium]|nr:helix-turn-helix domain-containing protein [Acidimicrobiales bacterium]
MARPPSRDKLSAIAESATVVFGRRGYRGTRMADVAAAAGVSSGSIFTYVESKEALFFLVFAAGFGVLDDPPLPVPTPAMAQTVALVRDQLQKAPVSGLKAALKRERPDDMAVELREIVEERYVFLEGVWPLLAVIERCAVEIPELEQFYFRRARVGYFGRLASYLEKRASAGYLRPMPDYAVAARVVSETIAWFAWHRREGRDAQLYSDDAARTTVISFICAALLPEGGT